MANPIVCKFGGSLMATSESIKQVASIILDNQDRKYVTVAAPGIGGDYDTNFTDSLFEIAKKGFNNEPTHFLCLQLMNRIKDITDGLGLAGNFAIDFLTELERRLKGFEDFRNGFRIQREDQYIANILWVGEYYSAKILTAYLQSLDVKVVLIQPYSNGLALQGFNYLDADISDFTYGNISGLSMTGNICIFPGSYGYNPSQEIMYLFRKGSDLTGAVLAKAYNVDTYEIWTNFDRPMEAPSDIVESAQTITCLSYGEAREYIYNGYQHLHHKVIDMLIGTGVDILIKNTSNPDQQGTLIKDNHRDSSLKGINCKSGFCMINVRHYDTNDSVLMTANLTSAMSEMDIPYQLCPSGSNSMSFLVEHKHLPLGFAIDYKSLLNIESDQLFDLDFEYNISLITIVGDCLKSNPEILGRAISVLREENIYIWNLNFSNQSPSVTIVVNDVNSKIAVQQLHAKLFG